MLAGRGGNAGARVHPERTRNQRQIHFHSFSFSRIGKFSLLVHAPITYQMPFRILLVVKSLLAPGPWKD